jgi:hypothetical protein
MKKLLPILFTLTIFALHSHGQLITRGAAEGEIYLSKVWYVNQDWETVHAIWRSTDNGRHLTNQYASTTMPEQGTRFDIVSDAAPGVLYGVNYYKLYISYNFGETWDFVENTGQDGRYASGHTQGEVYKYNNIEGQGPALWRSVDYTQNYTLMNEQVYGIPEIGLSLGEFYLRTGTSLDGLFILKSNDFGFTFDTIPVNQEIAGTNPGGYYPTLSRGATPGELYLVTWHLPASDYVYRIYYSSDYGQTFQLQYQSDETNMYYWGYSFSAGRELGSFYVSRGTGNDNDNPTHTHQYIDYSTDYGKSFTTFFHNTDSNYNGNPTSISHTVSAIVEPSGYGTVEGFGRFAEGTEITVTATPNEGYEFVNWTENGEVVSELVSYTFAVERTLTLIANFKLINGATLDNLNLFKSFPNPFSSVVTVECPLQSSEGMLRICNTMGNVIFTGKLNGAKTSFDLSHLPQGAYIYSIETNSRLVYRGILIKN